MNTKKIWWIVLLCVLGFAVTIIPVAIFVLQPPKTVTYMHCPDAIDQISSHPANNRQSKVCVWLGSYNNRLYYFGDAKASSNKTKYDTGLYVFQEDGLVKISSLQCAFNRTVSIVGMVENYIYYYVRSFYADGYGYKLYCINLDNNQETLLYKGNFSKRETVYFADDGSVYFPLWPEKDQALFVHVLGEEVLGIEPLTQGYPCGDCVYYLVDGAVIEQIWKADVYGNVADEDILLGNAHQRSIIPWEQGLLIHNEEGQSLLYQIDQTGNITELFHVSCLSSCSAVNIHKECAYISVLRYEKYGEFGMLRYENDEVEGTYRINLTDGSVEKINGMCFDAIYNFDDSGFYCADREGNIYKMAFDGTTTPVMLLS